MREGDMITSLTGVSVPARCIGETSAPGSSNAARRNFILADGEYLVQCPYDVSHTVTNVRMRTHLEKCRRNYIHDVTSRGDFVQYVRCPNNLCKEFPRPELEYHQQQCKPYTSNADIRFLGSHLRSMETASKRFLKDQPPVDEEDEKPGEKEEDWEKDAYKGYMSGYDPRVKLIKEHILVPPKGVSKEEMRRYRKYTARLAEHRMQMGTQQPTDSTLDETDSGDPYLVLYDDAGSAI